MLRWLSAIIVAICAVEAYAQQGVNQEPALQIQAVAYAINITPLRVEMDNAEFFEQVQIRNDSDELLNVQLRIFKWSQAGGTDQYAASSDILISPSITRIATHQTQNFRLLRANDKKTAGETRYRIIVDQLPNLTAISANQTQTRLRFSVPLFVNSDTATAPDLEWKISGQQLNIINKGGKTVKIGNVILINSSGERIDIKASGTRYVLGGSDVVWEMGADIRCDAGPLKIDAVVDQQIIYATPSTYCL